MTLAWRHDAHSWVASCGEEGQGVVRVVEYRDGWAWTLDMLPGTDEPTIRAVRPLPTQVEAKAEAERQVREWPAPIEGARQI